MEDKNPFDDLFDQISNLLKFVREHSTVPMKELKIPDDIEKRLDKLHRKIEKFNKLSEEIVNLSGVSEEELKMRLNGVSDQVPPEGQKLIDRSRQIKKEAQDINDQFELTLKDVPLSERNLFAKTNVPEKKILNDKEYQTKRRSKFKRFGSDKNWKPL